MAHKRIILKTKFKDDNEKCAVCLGSMQEKTIAILPCKHHFHYTCFNELTQNKLYTCPLCRYDLKPALKLLGIHLEEHADDLYYLYYNNLSDFLYNIILPQDYFSEIQAILYAAPLLAEAEAAAEAAEAAAEAAEVDEAEAATRQYTFRQYTFRQYLRWRRLLFFII